MTTVGRRVFLGGCRKPLAQGRRVACLVCRRRQPREERKRQHCQGSRTGAEGRAKITGIVGRDGGYTARVADAVVVIPTISDDTVTPHAESFQAVVWHMIVSDPQLKANEMKWESTK